MILSCGEALIDMVPDTTANGTAAFVPHSGGAVLNTAVALGRLGVPSGFFAGLSTDMFGAQLMAHLDASHVSHALCPRSDAPSTLAFVQLVNGQAKYAFFDENTALRGLAPSDIPALPDDIDALFFGGISLAYGACADTYETMMTTAAATHVTMIDPNIRPGFIRDEAAFRARLDRMIAAADIVKLSDEDLAWLSGSDDIAPAARALLARGPKLVLITQGAEGATAYHASHEVFVPATPVDLSASDTIGAGDTFNAGALAHLHRAGALAKDALAAADDALLRGTLDLAIRAAAVTVSRKGANPPWASELD
ncbi:carbohydrate kinase [Sulfitobacter sp. S190]|uniref:carbohydrate kinase family protein n=1 Tax=Sulfitobacter sp. S190 TaxID=2867022 RepID=UPI0021A87E39|nr:carbohydrate kinase [Sulfitobacter sp. S190]UWR23594.1 carbohydrate kinase [Sulfitobacter sp. S190]